MTGTDKQISYIETLIESKQLTADPEFFDINAMDENEYADWRRRVKLRAQSLDRAGMSKLIGRLKELPWLPPEEAAKTKLLVPDGRYAVEIDAEWHLFRIWRGTRNPSVQHVYAVKGTEKGDRITGPDEAQAVEAIALDPGQAALEFGHRTGHCSRCGSGLDVNLSRKLGIGPVCMKHWFPNDARTRTADARTELRSVGIDPAEKYDSLVTA